MQCEERGGTGNGIMVRGEGLHLNTGVLRQAFDLLISGEWTLL